MILTIPKFGDKASQVWGLFKDFLQAKFAHYLRQKNIPGTYNQVDKRASDDSRKLALA